ncbi:MFS transporter [Paenibacillus alvei]|nr:MFS transporter [Paenibacillus alvei]MCY9543894.1 MFS transporter [Paenibacillus alvei]MCY9704630.1 MFS transporter [Paenibacillus alvei]MCY9732710.1 MFS transporter [Paenibacillus alvei]MEC0079443.1 MFS transporter [Paenibacillus alvei]
MMGTSARISEVSLSRSIVLLLATACGLAVANVYYAQPLLDAIAGEFGIRHSTIGIVITITQLSYAAGLLLLVPLGDMMNRRKLISLHMLLSVAALVAVGIAPNSTILFIGMACVGLLAVVTQVLVAYAANLAGSFERGQVVGAVTSGVVIGILLARSVAGILTDIAGWRSVYLVSAALLLIMSITLYNILPRQDSVRASLSYKQLLNSVLTLFKEEPILRIRAVLALLIFSAFSILWTSLVLPLRIPPLSLSHSAIGAFGLAGVAGAIAAAQAGRWADRGLGQRTTGAALFLLFASWLPISYVDQSLLALIGGIILLDFAVQAVHVTNQSMILAVRPESRSRLTAGYMIFYSLGSALGSIASTNVYAIWGWNGVSILGAIVSAIGIVFWSLTLRFSASRSS